MRIGSGILFDGAADELTFIPIEDIATGAFVIAWAATRCNVILGAGMPT